MSGEPAWQAAESLASWAWRASWQGAALAVFVGVLLWLAGRQISPAWRFGLWGLVLVRLAIPAIAEIKLPPFRPVARSQPPSNVAKTPAPHASSPATPLTEAEIALAIRQASATAPPIAKAVTIAPTPTPTRTPTPRPSWPAIRQAAKRPLIALWLAGVAALLLRVLWSSLRLARAVRRTPIIDDPRVLDLMSACANELALHRAPQARALPAGGAPALVGFLRPTVLLPTRVIDGMGDDDLRLILLHELAHVKRLDVLTGWLATLVAVLHWPNPAVWLVNWRLRAERELACDEMVLRATQGGNAYARTIVKLVEALSTTTPFTTAPVPAGAIGILEGKSQIQRRLLMIARFDASGRRWPAIAAGLGLVVAAMALSGATRAAEPAKAPAEGAAAAAAAPSTGGLKPSQKSPADAKPGTAPRTGGAGSPAEGAGQTEKPKPPLIIPTPASPEDDAANAKTAAKLKQVVQQVTFNGQAFGDVVDFLRDTAKVDIVVEWNALEQAGINRDAPVTLQLREPTSIDAILPLMFRSMGLGVQYELVKGVVVIGPSTSEPTTVMRVYDVSDLISKSTTADAPATPASGPGPVPGYGGRGGGFGGGGGGGGFPGVGAAADGQSGETDQLIHLITATIEPNTWRESGGSLGTITAFKNKIVVKTAEGIHKEIAALLEMLRDKPAAAKEKHGGF